MRVAPIEIRSARLLLRPWIDADRAPFASLNADPEVMRFFPDLQSRAVSDASIDRWSADIAERGWGNWAVETLDGRCFIGFVGLSRPRRALPFTPCVELGYRLARAHWRKGYALEASRAALHFGYTTLVLDEIVAYTAAVNHPSRAVMERLGMLDSGEDFDHPAVPDGSPLRRHSLYRLRRERWQQGSGSEAAGA